MPDRIDDTLDFIRSTKWITSDDPRTVWDAQANRVMNRRGEFYALILSQEIAGLPRGELNSALSIGDSRNNSPDQKALRKGMRAIMLATAAFKKTTQLGAVKDYWLTRRDQVSLRSGFIAMFPSITTASGGADWDPQNFTDAQSFPFDSTPPDNDGDYRVAKLQYQLIVHGLPLNRPDIIANPNSIITKWAAISTAVIDEQSPFTYTAIGVVLSVAAGGIALASPVDTETANHTGMAHNVGQPRGYYLPETPDAAALTGEDYDERNRLRNKGALSGNLTDRFFEFGVGPIVETASWRQQFKLRTPSDVLRNGRNTRHNEVVVFGPKSRITAFYMKIDAQGNFRGNQSGQITTVQPLIAKSSKANNLPILLLQGGVN